MPRTKKTEIEENEDDFEPTEKKSWVEESNDNLEEINMNNTKLDEEELFNREKAIANEDKKVSECNEAELLEILWRRGNDNLNIALRKGVEKLYRMLRGDRIHPPRSKNENRRKTSYRGRGRYKKQYNRDNNEFKREYTDES